MCSYLAHRIDSLEEHWDHYPAEGLIRLGGASCTLAGHDEAYRQRSRSVMYGAFGDLYTLILGHLKSCLGTDAVRYSDHGFAPGMLINYMPTRPRLRGLIEGRLATAGFHFDSQASFAFPECHPDWYQISFLLPLELPVGGHGLLLFEATQETKMGRAILSRRAYHPYRVGGDARLQRRALACTRPDGLRRRTPHHGGGPRPVRQWSVGTLILRHRDPKAAPCGSASTRFPSSGAVCSIRIRAQSATYRRARRPWHGSQNRATGASSRSEQTQHNTSHHHRMYSTWQPHY